MSETITSLTLPQDQRKYKRMTKSLYYRQGFRLITFGFALSLYNLASLPAPVNPSQKLLFYGLLLGTFGVISFTQQSKKLNIALSQLDEKYHKQYTQHLEKQSPVIVQQNK